MRQPVGILLAGGFSVRMNAPKANLRYADQTFLSAVHKTLLTVCSEVVCVGDPEQVIQTGIPIVPDEKPDQGPLRGILTGMQAATADYYLIAAVDTPLVKASTYEWLWNEKNEDQITVIESDEFGENYLNSIWPAAVKGALENALHQNEFRVGQFLRNQQYTTVKLDASERDVKQLVNINTPEDYQRYIR